MKHTMNIDKVMKLFREKKIQSAYYQGRRVTTLHMDLNESFPEIRKSLDGEYVNFSLKHEDLHAEWQVTYALTGFAYDWVLLHGVQGNKTKIFQREHATLENAILRGGHEGWAIVGGSLYVGAHAQSFGMQEYEAAEKVAQELWKKNL